MTGTLVTGATGQDGSYLLEALAGEGERDLHALLQVDEAVPGWLRALPVTVHHESLAALPGLVDRLAPATVFHLAGLSSVALSWAEPVRTAEVNALPVAGLLEACRVVSERAAQPVRVVQAASAEVFAGTDRVPQDERTPLAPRSPYGAAKAYALHLGQVYRERGLEVSTAILYNHESPRRPRSFVTRKITSTVAAIARGEASELVLGNLDARRDWGWAPDYVDALRRMATGPADDYVVATGRSASVADFVDAAFARVGLPDGRQRHVRTDPAFLRPADAAELVGDAQRARERLGWAPTLDLTEIVGRMVDADLAG